MTQSAIIQPTFTLEDRRAEWRDLDSAEYARRHEWKRDHARRTWPLYLQWCAAQGRTSRLQFMVWLSGEDKPPTRLYGLLSAGAALHAGLDFDLGVTDLATLGRALDRYTADELRDRLEAEGLDGIKAEITEQRQEGEVKLPVSELPAVRAAIQAVSENETLGSGEALALIVQAHAALPETVRASAIEAAKTGTVFADAARSVVERMLDPHAWLASQPCAVPGCGMPSQELHHLKLPDTRFRTQNILLPLCARHHRAEPGHHSVAAHAQHQTDWIVRFWPSETDFWREIVQLYARRLFGDGATLNALEDTA